MSIAKGEIIGIVGESGCGKSVTSLSIMRLLPKTGVSIKEGEVLYKGINLLNLTDEEMRRMRGNELAMIFQDPMSSLNPVRTIGFQLSEAVMLHRGYSGKQARIHAIEMLKKVHIPRPDKIIDEYPHQLSGGMRQRVMIAMAMSCEPDLLIADEPTTALDVTIQAQILDLMLELRNRQGTSILFITHDLGVIAELCERVFVMYAGQIVEEANVSTLFDNPSHPYTQGLLKSTPKLNRVQERLDSITGNVPLPGTVKQGCRFASRCPHTKSICLEQSPPLFQVADGQRSRCWLHAESQSKEDQHYEYTS
ncbi:ABC transporter ATP-binding protein [Paenibacillus sp. S3N08]|uniref:ABC transporter ATP-binding protein n=2 Tax=Paenibacillus agricola TaxID=2716264 RepID=A0ABX0JBU8_9BACL|nr:ABC transporter ATP-binding protein [Paenibacillus agricola]